MNTKMTTEISFLLALGVILKIITDMIFRTGLSFLFIDLTMIITVFILYRYPTFKVALLIAFAQTIYHGLLFTTTDIWFIRPIIVLLAFGFMKLLAKRKHRFIYTVFLTSKFTFITISLLFILIVFAFPQLINYDTISQQSEMLLDNREFSIILEENFKLIMLTAAVILGLLYAYIPAFANMFIAWMFYKTAGKRIFKETEPVKVKKKDSDEDKKPLD